MDRFQTGYSPAVIDNEFDNKTAVTMHVVKTLLENDTVTIEVYPEGPDLESNGLYKLLDEICLQFGFNKNRITITTANKLEKHSEYNILIRDFHWPREIVSAYNSQNNDYKSKIIGDHLFASFTNRPTWYRICLANYLHKTNSNNIVTCNISWDYGSHRAIPFNKIADEASSEFYELAEFLKKCPMLLENIIPLQRVVSDNTQFTTALLDLCPLYKKFFIEVYGSSFTVGRVAYLDEKDIRPMLCRTPFINYSAQGHLMLLKGLGFKTFNKWWDESYDNYNGYSRLIKIYRVIDYVSSMTKDQHKKMYEDMLPTLEHNFNRAQELYGK